METYRKKISNELLEKTRRGDKKSFHELEQLAEDGNAQAISNLAQIYLTGFGVVESSYKKALELFRKAAALDDIYSLVRLGEFYRDAKYGLEQNGYKAAEYFIKAAEHADPLGVAKCLNLAAEIYRYGKGVIPDGKKAVELYKKLEQLESRGKARPRLPGDEALFKLAEIYTTGCANLKPDAQKAIECLTKAHGDYELAEFYRKGKAGIKPDGYKVIEHLARLGDLKGIAEIYLNGEAGVQPNGYKAIEYLTKELARDKGKTLDELAEHYFKSDSDEHNDAVEYFSDSKEICNVDTFQEIAKIYLHGKGGVQPDVHKSLKYFSQAAEAIDHIINFTKNFAENHSDVKKKRQGFLRRVFHWLERTAKNISEQLAEIYYSLNDGKNALKYFLKADEFNDEFSFIPVAKIYREGIGNLKPDGVKLVEYLTKKLEQDKFFAENILYDIAQAYEEGCGSLEPNMQKAIEFYKKSAALGNDDAVKKLVALTGTNE